MHRNNKIVDVCISIVSHNQNYYVEKLLCSLEKYLIVKNNKPLILITHNTFEKYKNFNYKKFNVIHIQNLRPKGFGDNQNNAFEIFDPNFFLIVNPDVELFEPLSLEILLKEVPVQGLCSPTILNHNKEKEDFTRKDLTIFNLIFRILGLKKSDHKWDWLAGMFLVVKGKHFRALRGFDTSFFLYVEDCDLCMRSKKIGGVLKVIDDISVIHDARRNSRKKIRFFIQHILSILIYWKKKYFWGDKKYEL